MRLALLMISNFGRADGGRETWAYQFLPRMLARHPSLHIDILGLHCIGQPDNRDELLAALPQADRDRVTIRFLKGRPGRLPLSAQFLRAVRHADWPPHRPDLALGVGSFVELLALQRAPRLDGVPKAAWLRTIYVDEKAARIPAPIRSAARAAETAILRRADLIIANGEDTAAHYRARGLAVEVIANAVDVDRWRMPPPNFESPLEIAFIGRLTAVKGAGEFLELCRRFASDPQGKAVRFHTVGDGEFADQAKQLARDGLLVHHGTLPNTELPAVLGKMDIAVALTFAGGSRRQFGGGGVSNALLEQLAAGRLAIAWNNPAFRQVIREGEGILVDQGSVDGLSDALTWCLNHPDDARHRSQEGQRRAADFDWDTHLDRFDAALSRVIGQR